MLLALLIFGYASGTYSSRRIEAATYDSLAFRYIENQRGRRRLISRLFVGASPAMSASVKSSA